MSALRIGFVTICAAGFLATLGAKVVGALHRDWYVIRGIQPLVIFALCGYAAYTRWRPA